MIIIVLILFFCTYKLNPKNGLNQIIKNITPSKSTVMYQKIQSLSIFTGISPTEISSLVTHQTVEIK